jgi:hypothetical protein
METVPLPPGTRTGLYRRVVATVAAASMSLALSASARPTSAEEIAHPAAIVAGSLEEADAAESCAAPPDTAEGWTAMMANVEGWNSGDGITSVKLPLGQIIISAADNIGLTEQGQPQFRRNSLLSVCGEQAKTVDRNGEAIPSVGNEWYWPGEMVVNQEQGKLYVFANRVTKTRDANANNGVDLGSFAGTGIDLAVFSLPKSIDEDPEFLYIAKTPASNSPEIDADGVRRTKQWGASLVQGNDGYLYIYGSQKDPRPYNFAQDAYVARVEPSKLEQPEAWQYFAGKKGWTKSDASATPVINSAKQPGLDVSWTTGYNNGRFTIISKRDGALGKEIGEWTAATPVGPFNYRKLTNVAPFNQAAMTYNAHLHPAIALRNGGMLVSLCQNTNGDLKYVTNNPELHRPVWYSFSPQPVAK